MTRVDGDPYAASSTRTAVYDDAGNAVVTYTLSERTRGGRPWADQVWRPEEVAARAAANAVLQSLAGHTLSTSDAELAGALAEFGASEMRHAHAMSHPLTSVPDVPTVPGVDVQPISADQVDEQAERLGEIHFRAYPVGHPDHEYSQVSESVREIRGIGRGEVLGPFMGQSTVAVVKGEAVGACLLVTIDGLPPHGGPWVVDVFRDPRLPLRGVGGVLIAASIAQCLVAGLPGLSLAVSHANARALALYGELGFIEHSENWTLGLP